MPSGSYDMRQYVEFAHAIGVAMQNNCPTAEWYPWKYVPENVKKAVMDQLLIIINLFFDCWYNGRWWCAFVKDNGWRRFQKRQEEKSCGTGSTHLRVVKSDMRTSFWFDVGVLLCDKYVADLESRKAILEEPNWDIGKNNPNLMKAIDNMFKPRIQEWKFDNQREAELQREPELSVEK
ncbi:uncharacterized protein LOC126586165 isoform X2 [Malus sylvestris]|uniref:uncharacterized protein LOC126586165 isoform X2 n=1 Tax=Malus sylvestris TaxID=3752 RepID=UPI0021AD367F|nr:uncharacterized protein LOC126586165 isoform X2 [Malus sylvestris]